MRMSSRLLAGMARVAPSFAIANWHESQKYPASGSTTNRVGTSRGANMTDKNGVVEDQETRFKALSIRREETKFKSPSSRSDSALVARFRTEVV